MSIARLNALSFEHLYSESDADFLQELKEQTLPACDAGFSEWKSDTVPSISIGWGWFIHSQSRRLLLAPDAVRSNVMLVDALGYDLGQQQTSHLFGAWLSIFAWQNTVESALRTEVASC